MTSRPTTCPHEGVDERVRNLVHFGELSAARITLEGAQVALGTGDIERVDESRKETAAPTPTAE